MRRSLLLALLFVGLLGPGVRAEDEDPGPRPPRRDEVLLGGVVSDPQGEATRLAREASAALAADDPERAYARFLELADRHGDVLLPLRFFGARRFGRTNGALRWPARRAVNLGLARMPDAFRARAAEHWLARTVALEGAAARGDTRALETLAGAYGVTPAGSAAMLLLAARDAEAGRATDAARRYERWLELNPRAAKAARAAVAVRLADTLGTLDDAGALGALGVLAHALREEPVRRAGVRTTLAERIAALRAPSPEDTAADPEPAAPVRLPAAPVVLWSRSLRDPGFLRQGGGQAGLGVSAGAWGRGDALVLHEGRVVRRLDVATGLERWRFPLRRPVTIHGPDERYHGHDIPWRAVTPAGDDAVLVVLGDPAASGRYTFLEEEYEADQLGQECRLRLACLDLETGALRWHTGAVDDTHPVLGHRATGCSSPPLVVGSDVYCVFARRLGATTFFLACLDLATGRPRWVAPLAAGESGRGDDQSLDRDRFTSPYAQSVPFGARPALAAGEVCAVPHAGFAAGVAAADGQVRWVRALPRYVLDVTVSAGEGHNVRNTPVPWGDAWILAAMDSPRLVCVARGSGDLRWQRGEPTPDGPPDWRDVLGVGRDAAGRPQLRLSGWQPLRMDPARGALAEGEPVPEWEEDGDDPGGAALDVGERVVRLAAGALQVRAWDTAAGPLGDVPLPARGTPRGGDVVRCGDVWVLVGRERVAALADPGVVRATAPEDEADDARRAAALAVRARLDGDPARLGAARKAAARVGSSGLRARAYDLIAREAVELVEVFAEEDGELENLRATAAVVRALPPRHQGAALRELSERLGEIGAWTDAAQLLVHWLETASDVLVPLDGGASSWLAGNAVRGDLLAARRLRAAVDDPAVRAVLEARERRQAEHLADVLRRETPEGVARALRQAAGTRAAAALRRVLLRRAEREGRFDEAAALAADLRLDPPWLGGGVPAAARLREAALLQMREADLVARAGDGERARELAGDLERWGPGGLREPTLGTQTALRTKLRRAFGWHPTRAAPETIDVWSSLGRAKDRDEMRSVEFLALQGPGADKLDDYVFLVRGLTVEVWSRSRARRLAALHGPDEGWFGGSLANIDGWVPGGGILVSSIVAGEPADLSGVRGGDWVHTWAGRPVPDLPTFMQLVASSRPGHTIPVGIWRHGKRVLARFTAGRRPPGQGRLVNYPALWVDAARRVLLPGRTGLAWIDPQARTRRAHWTWTEPGVVRRCDVYGGRAFVLINRGLRPDVVVAVDVATGREAWRREVRGSVTWIEAVGSALWIHTIAPGTAHIVDRRDGRPRAVLRTFDRHRDEFRKNWHPDREADVACGRGVLVSGTDRTHVLRVVNTTTCTVEHTDAWDYARGRRVREYVNPQVAAGPFVSVVRGGQVRLYFLDPLGGAPRHVLDLSAKDVLSNQTQFGAVDRDARLFIRGNTLYVVRVPINGRRNVNISVFGIDYEALGRRDPTDRAGAGRVVHMRTSTRLMSGPAHPRRYVLSIRPYPEGLLVSAARLTGDHRGETWWVAAMEEGGAPDNVRVRLLERPMSDARRHPPVRIGSSLFVPTDEGALIYPVTRYGAK